jgi:hypothetical protein
VLEKEIDKLTEETRRLNALLKSRGGQPIRLTANQHRRLDAMRKDIDPEILKRIDLLDNAE